MPGLDWEEWVEKEERRRRALTAQVIGLITLGALVYYTPLINRVLGCWVGSVITLATSVLLLPSLGAAPPESVLVGVIGYLLVLLFGFTASITGFGLFTCT